MRTYLVEACENIDAALFSGDEFDSSAASRDQLMEYINRWTKVLGELSDVQGVECTDLKSDEK